MAGIRLPLLMLAPIAYLWFCAFVAALLAYPLHFVLPKALSYQVLVYKSAEIFMLLGVFPLGRWLGVGWAEMGLAGPWRQWGRQLLRGFGYGALMMGLHVALLLLLYVRIIDHDRLELGRVLSLSYKGVLIGLGIALLEEPLFRGFLQGFLSRKTHRFIAVLIGAFYFAALHFLKTDVKPEFGEVRWSSGFLMVADAFGHLGEIRLDAFLALFAVGALLGVVRLFAPGTGLSYCMGLHAGWVCVIKVANPVTIPNLYSPKFFLISSFDGNIGYLSAAWTGLLTLWLAMRLIKNPPATPPVPL